MTCERHEQLTDVEVAREAYLTLVSADDELPDNPKVDAAAHLMGDLWARLRGPYCQEDGCENAAMPHFPWCVEHRPRGGVWDV